MLSLEWDEAIEGYLGYERAAGNRRTTIDARRQHLRHFARRTTRRAWQVTADDVLDYFGSHEWSPETRRGRRTTLMRFYAWGMFRGYVPRNPASDVPRVTVPQAHARPAPDRTYHEALIAAPPRERLMLRLAAEVGMRRAEVAQVHTDDLHEDLVGLSLTVHGKGGRRRVVPLPSSLGRQLAAAERGYLFPGNDHGHLSPRYVGKLVRDLLPGDWTMHTLRHRFGTRAYALTSDLLLVQEMLGHASPTTTRRYVQYDRARLRNAIEELAS